MKFDFGVPAVQRDVGVDVETERNHAPRPRARMRELECVGTFFRFRAGKFGVADETAIGRRNDDRPIILSDDIRGEPTWTTADGIG